MKRHIYYLMISVLAVCLILLVGCKAPTYGSETTTAEGTMPDTTAAETEVPAVPLDIISGGKCGYTIVRAEDDCPQIVRDAASQLVKAFLTAGIDVNITTDWERNPVKEFEILVGKTSREVEGGYTADRELLGDGYIIKAVGKKLFITGGSDKATAAAVTRFIDEYLKPTEKPENLQIPADYELVYSPTAKISSVLLCGKPLAGVFADDDTQMAADALRRAFFGAAGVVLPFDEVKNNASVTFEKNSETDNQSLFEISVKDGRLIIKGGDGIGFVRGIKLFREEVLDKTEGVFEMNEGYSFKKDYGEFVTYESFGAKGDGKTDDFYPIIAAHDYANQYGLPVLAKEGARYYLSGDAKRITIQTDTDFSNAEFIIDDTAVENRGREVFIVSSKQQSFNPAITTLKAGQTNIGITLPCDCLITAVDANVKRYIRYGANQNSGSSQTDVFKVDKNGNVDPSTPILWDFDNITTVTAFPIDETTLTIRGGIFTTIANRDSSNYTYYYRGIRIYRSNVVVDGLVHNITGEGATGAPYYGILIFHSVAEATVKNCVFTGHKTYTTIGSAGTSVSMGTYELTVTASVNVSVVNCTQTNDILDTKYWGVFASNYGKNLVFDGCVFSRFDAHQGVANATIKNSTLGHQGINLIGSGTCLIENSTVYSKTFVNLRSDYGSTWNGKLIIRNSKFIPASSATDVVIVGGSNKENHDFGYTCYLPTEVEIDGLYIDDSGFSSSYGGPKIFANINSSRTTETYSPDYPIVVTEKITVKKLTTEKGATPVISANMVMFKNTVMTVEQ